MCLCIIQVRRTANRKAMELLKVVSLNQPRMQLYGNRRKQNDGMGKLSGNKASFDKY